jgi:hypothetical protein
LAAKEPEAKGPAEYLPVPERQRQRANPSPAAGLRTAFFVGPQTDNPDWIAPFSGNLVQRYLGEKVPIEAITEPEWNELEGLLSLALCERDRSKIQSANNCLFATCALRADVVTLRDLERELIKRINACESVLQACCPTSHEPPPQCAKIEDYNPQLQKVLREMAKEAESQPNRSPSVRNVLAIHVIQNGPDTRPLVEELKRLQVFLHRELDAVGGKTSRRGPKGDIELEVFLQTLFEVCDKIGADTALPSKQLREVESEETPTNYFQFVIRLLKFVFEKGERAIDDGELTEAKRVTAHAHWLKIRKAEKTLLEHCYAARKAVQDHRATAAGATSSA